MSPESVKYEIDFEPLGRRIQVEAGTTLLEAAQEAGVQIASICGGIGSCDSCKLRLVQGKLSPTTLEEQAALSARELSASFRLACQALPLGNVKVDIPPESLTTVQRLQLEGLEITIELDLPIKAVDIIMDPPSLVDLRSDDVRVVEAAHSMGIIDAWMTLAVLRQLPDQLRSQNWSARLALRNRQIVAALPPNSPLLGLAVDVGTTKLAVFLVDLSTGKTLESAGAMNPQVAFGEDVVSRIAYANRGEEQRSLLHARLMETLNKLVRNLCKRAGVASEAVVEAVVVGNTAMHHFFLDLPVRQLGESPYLPAAAEPIQVPAGILGLDIAPAATVYLPPNVAGYVGADHVAMVLATEIWRTDRSVLALDIGTNTEITLASRGRLLSCSTASGPVFEGAHIREGMRAAPGAIERARFVDGELRWQTIDNQPPVGICGSGILDVVAEFLRVGVIDLAGRFQPGSELANLHAGGGGYVLVPAESSGHSRPILVDRRDIHEIQLAKGAIRAGIEILLAESDLHIQALDEIIIAGAFGTYIHVPSAIRVGMLPNLPLERFRQVGNAAGVGARQMLVSTTRRDIARQIVQQIEYVELTTARDFSERFVQALYFPEPG